MFQYAFNDDTPANDAPTPDQEPNIPQDLKDWIDRHLAEEEGFASSTRYSQPLP
jgi:hypothetical protein